MDLAFSDLPTEPRVILNSKIHTANTAVRFVKRDGRHILQQRNLYVTKDSFSHYAGYVYLVWEDVPCVDEDQ